MKAFKKANKERRAVLANRAGFNTPDEYKTFLEEQILKDIQTSDAEEVTAPSGDIVVHNVHILDASGSMDGLKLRNAVLGINGEVKELRQDTETNYLHTSVRFGSRSETLNFRDTLDNVKDMNQRILGMTALNQTLGETLERLRDNVQPNEVTVVKVFTDGGENVSFGKYRDSRTLRELIKECESHKITVTFVGQQNDVQRVVNTLGVDESNTLVHNNTGQAVMDSFAVTRSATKAYVAKAKLGEDTLVGFYKGSGEL